MTDLERFREWLREPLPALPPERCDECGAPAVVTFSAEGETSRACVDHVSLIAA
jgi:hypothetical protein